MKFLLIILTLSLSLSSFAQFGGAGSSSGSGNPAVIFCKNLGGSLSIQADPNNGAQFGICTIDAWKLFRNLQDKLTELELDINLMEVITADLDSDIIGMPNPALKLCEILQNPKDRGPIDQQGQSIEDGNCSINDWYLVFSALEIAQGYGYQISTFDLIDSE